MSSSRRWLIFFSVIIGVVAISTVFLVLLTKDDQVVLLPDNTPQGTVQRYLIAIQDQDYEEAYGYLSFEPSQNIESYDAWLRMTGGIPQTTSQTVWKATLGTATRYDDSASVEVTIDTLRPGGPFSDPVRSQLIFFRLAEISGEWFITSPTYIYWIY
ncbi:MAG: hypothetical protein JXA46_10290 [Dehalococcoidales bacterium]|nr:hypothetical protein [Dehalococcoidales bacterium]